MRRFLLMIMLLALSSVAWAELKMSLVSATATNSTVTINASYLAIENQDTTNNAWVRVFTSNDTVAAATAAAPSVQIRPGKSLALANVQGIRAVSVICAGGETATVSLVYW